MRPEIRILPDAAAVAREAAAVLAERARSAAAARGRFTVALSGGSTPRGLFRVLATDRERPLPWAAVHVFWGDERCVGPEDPASNFRAAWNDWLSGSPLPAANLHRMAGDDPEPTRAAAAYEQTLRGNIATGPDGLPRLDLVFLGLGADGHTASLFPHSAALTERTRLVVATTSPVDRAPRLTLSLPVINHARCVAFLVSGDDKAAALARVLAGPRQPEVLPAQGVSPADGELLWLVDRAAARRLPDGAAHAPGGV